MSDGHDCPLQDAEDGVPTGSPTVPTQKNPSYVAECDTEDCPFTATGTEAFVLRQAQSHALRTDCPMPSVEQD